MRRTGHYDFAWFYQYYLENRNRSRALISFEMFHQSFNMYFQMNAGHILYNIDKAMNVTKLEDEQGNLLYIN